MYLDHTLANNLHNSFGKRVDKAFAGLFKSAVDRQGRLGNCAFIYLVSMAPKLLKRCCVQFDLGLQHHLTLARASCKNL